LEEGEVVVGFAIATGGDAAERFQPGIRALDRPALSGVAIGPLQRSLAAPPDLAGRLSGHRRLPAQASPADPRLDRAGEQFLFEPLRVIATVGPQLAGLETALDQRVDQREQIPALVLVAGAETNLEWLAGRIDR
jgi:hypothetical protein